MSDNEENEVVEEQEENVGMGEEDAVGLSKRKIRKNMYWGKLESALSEYKNILIIGVDFVGSKQMQKVRLALRGKAAILMGKNTIMRKVIRDNVEKNAKLEALLPYIKGNMGFVFTNETNLKQLRADVTEFKEPAAAKVGVIAPIDVIIPAGPTGLDPGQTSFFQTLNISTKISKGTIEITNDVKLCIAGEKVTASAVALLNKLGIRPFEFGITVNQVYEDGSVYDAEILDMSETDLMGKFASAAGKLAAVSFEIGQTNLATLPHSFKRAFKTLCALAISTDYMFEEMKEIKERIDNPDAFGGAAAGGDAAGGKAAAAPEPEEEEEEAAPAMDMFGGDAEEEGGDY
jgi:large subunit ribosomal protein LP0